MDHLKEKFFENFAMAVNGTVLDPKGINYCGMVGTGANRQLQILGRWSPYGEGDQYFGPEGDPNTSFNGCNKWCALIIVRDFWNNFKYVRPFAGSLVNIPGDEDMAVHVYIIMNDDDFTDNRNHPDDPMRYIW